MSDRDLAAQAEAAFKETTISYPDWKRRVDAGKYADVKVTKWWQGFDALRQIDPVVEESPPPPPPPPPPPSGSVAVVIPPSAYTIPDNATAVSTTSQLLAALANGAVSNIVLENGDYDNPGPILVGAGKNVYARNLLAAKILAGIRQGANSTLRGLDLNVSSLAKAADHGTIVYPVGTGAAMRDCKLNGNKVCVYGVNNYAPQGSAYERCEIRNVTDVGLRLSTNRRDSGVTKIQRIRDINIDGVKRAIINSSNGTAEAGLWVGHPVVEGVERIRVRDVAISGIETVNDCLGVPFKDLDIDLSAAVGGWRIGVYMEHWTWGSSFDRFDVRGCRMGFNGEWAAPSWGGTPGARDVTIKNGRIESSIAGSYLDDGSGPGIVFDSILFVGQAWAAIAAYRYSGGGQPTMTNLTFQMQATAKQYRTDHVNTAPGY